MSQLTAKNRNAANALFFLILQSFTVSVLHVHSNIFPLR
jgi:hypothetical protein